jgi:hypothetical protein
MHALTTFNWTILRTGGRVFAGVKLLIEAAA